MKQPTTPLPCPICGRKPQFVNYSLRCDRGTSSFHVLQVSDDNVLFPTGKWNAYVRRIRARIAKENAK